jgi:putative FmdB family regulatory protein
MPVYEYQCMDCGQRHEAVRTVKERGRGPICCGSPAEQRIFHSPPATYRQMEPYKCPATGEIITSSRQRKQIMKENNLTDASDFGTPDWDRMVEERKEFHATANKELPQELQRAIKREGLDSVL